MAIALMDSLGPTAFKMLYQALTGLVIVVILVVLFFGSKYFFAARKKRKSFRIRSLIINTDGTWFMDFVGKFKDKDGLEKMIFLNSKETMDVIPLKYVKGNQVILWRYAPGQYAIIPPNLWMQNPKKFKIDIINTQMKNFSYLEMRAAVTRWAYMKDLLAKWAPFITMAVIGIMGCVCVWLVMKTGMSMYADVVQARLLDCSKVLVGGSAPVG